MPLRVTALTDPARTSSGYRLAWLADGGDGDPLGSAFLRVFTRKGPEHLAELQVNVHPAERRRGVGSRLLETAVAAAREAGGRSVIARADAGAPGDHFLAARGFGKVLALAYARLALDESYDGRAAGTDAIAERPHPGYRLVSWRGTVPGELAGAVADRGELLTTVAAVDESDGSVVGFSELGVPGDGKGEGVHYGTGVPPEHRGHGLGRRMKAESIRTARTDHPGLSGLVTDTADGNTHMRRINDALGCVPTPKALEYRLDL